MGHQYLLRFMTPRVRWLGIELCRSYFAKTIFVCSWVCLFSHQFRNKLNIVFKYMSDGMGEGTLMHVGNSFSGNKFGNSFSGN